MSIRHIENLTCCFVGISLNTSAMTAKDAEQLLQITSAGFGLPCIDPIRTGAQDIVRALEHCLAGGARLC